MLASSFSFYEGGLWFSKSIGPKPKPNTSQAQCFSFFLAKKTSFFSIFKINEKATYEAGLGFGDYPINPKP